MLHTRTSVPLIEPQNAMTVLFTYKKRGKMSEDALKTKTKKEQSNQDMWVLLVDR